MLNLNADEQAWLDEYRRQLSEKFPGLVEDIIIFGPYSRGISDPDVDFNVLALIKEDNRKKAWEVADLAYIVDVPDFCVGPTVFPSTMTEWEESRRMNGWIYNLAKDGVSVL